MKQKVLLKVSNAIFYLPFLVGVMLLSACVDQQDPQSIQTVSAAVEPVLEKILAAQSDEIVENTEKVTENIEEITKADTIVAVVKDSPPEPEKLPSPTEEPAPTPKTVIAIGNPGKLTGEKDKPLTVMIPVAIAGEPPEGIMAEIDFGDGSGFEDVGFLATDSRVVGTHVYKLEGEYNPLVRIKNAEGKVLKTQQITVVISEVQEIKAVQKPILEKPGTSTVTGPMKLSKTSTVTGLAKLPDTSTVTSQEEVIPPTPTQIPTPEPTAVLTVAAWPEMSFSGELDSGTNKQLPVEVDFWAFKAVKVSSSVPGDLITAYVDWGVGQGWQSAIVHKKSGNVIASYNYPSSGTRLVRFKFTSDYGGEIFAEVVIHIEHAFPEGTTPTPTPFISSGTSAPTSTPGGSFPPTSTVSSGPILPTLTNTPTPTPIPTPTPTPGPTATSSPSYSITLVTKWGGNGSEDGQFYGPSAIAQDASGNIYVGDHNNRIQKFDSNGNFILKWGSTCNPCGSSDDNKFYIPSGIVIDNANNVYVSDAGGRIQKFDSNGNFLNSWVPKKPGRNGSLDLDKIDIGPSGNIYVSAMSQNLILKYDANGNLLSYWPVSEESGFANKVSIFVSPLGSVYARVWAETVKKFDLNGNLQATLDVEGSVFGDTSGNIYLAGNPYLYKFDSNDNFVKKWTITIGVAGCGVTNPMIIAPNNVVYGRTCPDGNNVGKFTLE